uniref:Ribonuclease H-like domain-containing protein n=1 Tax=Tanacetum cinerariifolium TaxID=118510 RepID=A0A6L2MDU7_TANCI|nr:ribonuclease H-like domain-containing protein [Tanacetum cinerariifolium]
MTTILKQFQATPPLASVKAVEEICVTCGGAHPYYQCLVAGGNTFPKLRDNIQGYVVAAAVNYNHGNSVYRPPAMANQIPPSGFGQPNVQNNQNCNASTSGSGSLPSNTIANPKGKLKSITTRSGIVLDGPFVLIPPPFINLEEDERVEETLTDQDLAEYTIKVPPPPIQKYKPPSQRDFIVHQKDHLHLNIPYPSKMLKQKQQEKDEVQIHKFWKCLKLSFPTRRNFKNWQTHPLMKIAQRLSSRSYLKNLETLGNFSFHVVSKKLGLLELISTRMTLKLANRVIRTPAGIARDVFVSVDKFTFPADFVIVDYESDPRVPLILGRPFLQTARALIDVHGEEMILHLHPPLHVNPLSGNTTYFSSPNQLLEEFADELALITFPLEYDDDLQFDIESDLKEIEYLLHQDPIKDIDSSLKDSIDQSNLADLNDNLVDSMLEMFTDEHALSYSSPSQYDEYDDDLFEVEFDTENFYDDPFDSNGEKIKESKLDVDDAKWTKIDFIIRSWIFSTLAPSLRKCLVDLNPTTAKDAWTYIAGIFQENKARGLPSTYETISIIIVSREPFPDLKTVRSLLTTHETRLKSRVQNPLVDATSTSPMVLLAKSNTSARRGPSLEKANNPCWSFAKGSCRFGDACKYLHNGVYNKSTLLPRTSGSASSVPDVTRSDLDMLQSLLAMFRLNAPNTSTASPTGSNVGMAGLVPQGVQYLTGSLQQGVYYPQQGVQTLSGPPQGDFITRRVLLHCDSTGDLYPVTKPSTIPHAFLTSQYVWHQRLGHPGILCFVSRSLFSFKCEIKSFQCDHGGEFDNHAFHKLFHDNVYLLNTLPSPAINNEIPFTRMFGAQPDYSVLHVFGCLCYLHIDTNHKLGPRATPSIFLGHVANHFGYRCIDLNTNKIIISHHVTFDEMMFPFPSTKSTTTPSYDFLDDSTDLISTIIRTAPITPVPAPVHTLQVDVPTPATPPTPPPPPTPQFVPQIVPEHALAPINDSPTMSIHPMVTRSRVETTHPNPRYAGHVSTISPLPRSYKEAFNDPNCDLSMVLSRHLAPGFSGLLLTLLLLDLLLVIVTLLYLFTNMRKYAMKILKRAYMVGCNPSRTPVDIESKLGDGGTPVVDPTLYQSLAGSLQYLTLTRPDYGTLDYGLQLYSSTTDSLITYSDANWAGCPTTRRSTLGYCVFLGNNLLSWSSKCQVMLSRSSAKAEYRGIANAVAKTCWI